MLEIEKQFDEDDLLYSYKLDYDNNGIAIIKKEIKAKVIGFNDKGEIIVDIISGHKYMDENFLGVEFVKVGNLSNRNRQSGILFDSLTEKSPQIIIYDKMDNINKLFSQETIKVLLGKLGNIIDEDFQPLGDHYLTEDGMSTGESWTGGYSDGSLFLKGKIITKEGGKIGGFSVSKENEKWFLRSGSVNTAVGLSDGEYAFFAGDEDPSLAKAWIKNTGEGKFSNVTIEEGSYVKTTTLKDIENIPFLKDITFSLNADKSIKWTGGTIIQKGIVKTITGGSATVTQRYITWTNGSSVFELHSTIPTLTPGTFLLAYRNSSDVLIVSTFSQVIYSDLISVNSLSAISANIGTVTAGTMIGVIIKTSTSGKRVEISNNIIEIYDSNNLKQGSFEGITQGVLLNGNLIIQDNLTNTNKFLQVWMNDGINDLRNIINNSSYYIETSFPGAIIGYKNRKVSISPSNIQFWNTDISNVIRTLKLNISDDTLELDGKFNLNYGQSVDAIITTINNSSTNSQLPTGLSVYNLSNTKQPIGILANQSVSNANISVKGYSVVELVYATVVNLENLIDGSEGQIVTLFNSSSSSFTLNENTNLRLAGSFTFGQYDTLTLQYINSTIKWIEISRSNN